MGERQRLLVASLLRGHAADEINGIRRALGSAELGRIAPHITLVAPFNIDDTRLSSVCTAFAKVVADAPSLALVLAGVSTFAPDHHVIYLEVTGETDQLHRLHERCSVGVLGRPERRSYVAHVTLRSHADPGVVADARSLVGDFTLPMTLDRVSMLRLDEQSSGRRWIPCEEVALGSSAINGRGGREVEMTRAFLVGPVDRSLIEAAGVVGADRGRTDDVVIRASIAQVQVGVLTARQQGDLVEITHLVVDGAHRREGIARQLIGYLERLAVDLGLREIFIDLLPGQGAFFTSHGYVLVDARPSRTRPLRALRSLRD